MTVRTYGADAPTARETAVAFLCAMRAHGVNPREPDRLCAKLAVDTGLIRFRCEGERKANGWARLHLDGTPAGRFGNWRLGVVATWKGGMVQGSPVARAIDIAQMRAERLAERRAADGAGAERAGALWDAAKPASAHPYLTAKSMTPEGLRESDGRLLAPMRDLNGKLWNVQTIAPDGFKLFMPGARVDGLAWWRGEPGDTFAIGEGVATMAAVHAATGLCSVAAFTAGSLARVAGMLRCEHPEAPLILCADDDSAGQTNTGVLAATKAARAVNGLVARPPRPPGWPADKGHDFDDSYRALGPDPVRRALGCASALTMKTPR